MFKNKSILFVHLHNIDKVGVGIKNKIYAQLEGFKKISNEVEFITGTNNSVKLESKEILTSKNSIIARILNPIKAIKLIGNKSYDVVYIRGFGIDPFLLYFLFKLKSKKVIFEFPTFPYDQELKNNGFVKWVYLKLDLLCRPFLKKKVDFSTNFSDFKEIWGIPSIPIQNCINVSKVKYTGFKKTEGKLNLIGVAGLANYHGFDRVIVGLSNYYKSKNANSPEITFDVVGSGEPVYTELISLVEKLGLQSIVTFHGKKMGAELDQLFLSANLAIGSLGMHRIGLDDGSTLKVREYFARGIPFILGYNDLGVKEFNKYYLNVEASEEPINFNEVLNWYDNLNFNSQEMREIAESTFNWESEFKKVLNGSH